MNNMEKTKYKSWSYLKKQMNNLLCDTLKDRISYFYTTYHEVHNAYGRASIHYMGKELITCSWNQGYDQQADIIEQYKKMDHVPSAIHDYAGAVKAFEIAKTNASKEVWMQECKLCEYDFLASITTYLNTAIEACLCSDNYLLRVFAYMDRRVGKRTLVKIKDEMAILPEWVKQFYNLRCEAEKIIFA